MCIRDRLATTPATAIHPEAVRGAMDGLPSLRLWVVERLRPERQSGRSPVAIFVVPWSLYAAMVR